jgi:hypothetical protein
MADDGSRTWAFKVQVSPAQTAIHQGQTVMVTKPDGQVDWPSTSGPYFRDTSESLDCGGFRSVA